MKSRALVGGLIVLAYACLIGATLWGTPPPRVLSATRLRVNNAVKQIKLGRRCPVVQNNNRRVEQVRPTPSDRATEAGFNLHFYSLLSMAGQERCSTEAGPNNLENSDTVKQL
jgi:hypothetical protein